MKERKKRRERWRQIGKCGEIWAGEDREEIERNSKREKKREGEENEK